MRDLNSLYRQTVLGYLWALLPPLIASGTFILLQSQKIVQVQSTPIPYPAFALIGALLWQTFVEAMQAPIAALQTAKPILAKINFPREAVILSGAWMVGFNFLVRMVLIVGVMAIWKITPGASLVLFPLAVIFLIASGFAVGLALLPLGGLYADVGRGLGVIGQFWMFLTPVVYPLKGEGLASLLSTWNPISPLLVTAREVLANLPISNFNNFLVCGTGALLLCLAGLVLYRLAIPILIERMGN